MHPRRPKWLRLTRTQERRIEKLLNAVPHTEPAITIRPYDGEPFEVEVLGAPEYFVALEIGAEEVYADYSNSGALLEANHLRVARRVRISGARCLDVYETGGPFINGRVEIAWYGPRCCRIGRDAIRGFDSDNSEELSRMPRVFGPLVDVRWVDDTAEGPDLGVAGFAVVDVDGRSFECMHVVEVDRSDEDCNDGDRRLKTIYLTRGGRLILARTYLSREDLLREMKRSDEYVEEVELTTLGRVTWNGLEYLPWFDMLSGLALGTNPRTP